MRFSFSIVLLLFISMSAFPQRMSPEHFWLTLRDKDNNSYTLDSPDDFLSSRSILRRQKANIPIILQDLPVSDFYIDSLKSLGLNVVGISKWFNAVLVESSDSLLIDSLNYLDFVSKSSILYENFSTGLLESENHAFDFANRTLTEGEYANSYSQLKIIGGLDLHKLGFKGEGIQIAVLDAGFYRVDSFDYFKNLWENNQIIATKDFVNPSSSIFNESSHGMSVLGTMSVNSPFQYIGSSPEASYILLRSEDVSRETKVEEAYWVFAAEYADSIGADIITSSLGYHAFNFPEMNYDYSDLIEENALVTKAAELAISKGMIVINSAGNEGNSSWGKITTPSDGKNVLSVGAIDTSGIVAAFSSRGFEGSETVKPDVLAVGTQTSIITSIGTIGIGYGTSFSAPQIAGFTACLWQANPEKTNLEIIDAIRKSSSRYANPDIVHGYGIPNFMLALWILNGLNENEVESKIQIYPNPFLKDFYIKAIKPIISIEIFTISGKQIYSNQSGWESGEIVRIENCGINDAGLYLVKIRNQSEIVVKKIIKQ